MRRTSPLFLTALVTGSMLAALAVPAGALHGPADDEFVSNDRAFRSAPPAIEAVPVLDRFTVVAEEPVFWSGPQIDRNTPGNADCGGRPCWDYELDVRDNGYRLRIAIDHPEIGDVFTMQAFRPGGGSAGSVSPGDGLYSAELLTSPIVGVWRVRVIADNVDDHSFRVRAKVESAPPPLGVEDPRDDVLPNLQVLPPHDPTFIAPITNGSTGGEPQPLDVMGVHPLSCHAEEHVEEQAVRCLRFAFGVKNTGRGPMQLSYRGASVPNDQTLYQRVVRADGTSWERLAGLARYHKTHMHYHHHDAVALRLYRVLDPETGTMEPVGAEHRKGFAHRDELLREWRNFYPTLPFTGFGLRPGWADIYEWDRPGNYIDFGLSGDGHYLIRMTADPANGILESNDVDNAGYTYVRITGEDIEMLETGRGTDPWDRCKIVVPFGGHPEPSPDPDAPKRPEDCPPDTT